MYSSFPSSWLRLSWTRQSQRTCHDDLKMWPGKLLGKAVVAKYGGHSLNGFEVI